MGLSLGWKSRHRSSTTGKRVIPQASEAVEKSQLSQELARASAAEPFIGKEALAGEGPTTQQLAELAYHLWEKRGRPEGSPDEDWGRAEALLSHRTANLD